MPQPFSPKADDVASIARTLRAEASILIHETTVRICCEEGTTDG